MRGRCSGRNAVAGIGDGEARSAVRCGLPGYFDATAFGRVAHGVRNEVRECAVQIVRRAAQVAVAGEHDVDAMAPLREAVSLALEGRQQRAHRDSLGVVDVLLRLESRQGKQILDDLRHATRLAAQVCEHGCQLRHHFGFEHLEITVQHGQRCAQLVRHVGDEIATNLFEARERRDVAYDEQRVVARIRYESERQAHGVVERRGDVAQRFLRGVFGQPRLDRRRQELVDVAAAVARRGKAEQACGGFVEPEYASGHGSVRRRHRAVRLRLRGMHAAA